MSEASQAGRWLRGRCLRELGLLHCCTRHRHAIALGPNGKIGPSPASVDLIREPRTTFSNPRRDLAEGPGQIQVLFVQCYALLFHADDQSSPLAILTVHHVVSKERS